MVITTNIKKYKKMKMNISIKNVINEAMIIGAIMSIIWLTHCVSADIQNDVSEKVYEIRYLINTNDTGEISSINIVAGRPMDTSPKGDYFIKIFGDTNEVIESKAFLVDFMIMTDPPTESDTSGGVLKLRYNKNAKRVEMYHKNKLIVSDLLPHEVNPKLIINMNTQTYLTIINTLKPYTGNLDINMVEVNLADLSDTEVKKVRYGLGDGDIVYIIGNQTEISSQTENKLKELDYLTIKRLGGKDRFETAALIAKEFWQNGSDRAVLMHAFEQYHYSNAIEAAKRENAPILLTGYYSISEHTLKALEDLGVKKIFLCNEVNQSVLDFLKTKYEVVEEYEKGEGEYLIEAEEKFYAKPEPPKKFPEISVSPDIWDAGVVPEKETREKTFTIYNNGDAELNISQVTTGYAWLEIDTSGMNKKVMPGESTTFKVTIVTKYAHGNTGGTVVVWSNDPKKSQFEINFDVKVEEDVIRDANKTINQSVQPPVQPPKPDDNKDNAILYILAAIAFIIILILIFIFIRKRKSKPKEDEIILEEIID